MTHYTIKYDLLQPSPVIDALSILDIQDYLGPKTFKRLGDMYFHKDLEDQQCSISSGKLWLHNLHVAMSFLGIQGRPAHAYIRAWWSLYGPKTCMTGTTDN